MNSLVSGGPNLVKETKQGQNHIVLHCFVLDNKAGMIIEILIKS